MFGHSFGGWVAQELALRHPDRVPALILAATTPGQLGSTESPDDDQGPPPPGDVMELMARQPASDAELIELYTKLAPHFLRGADTAAFIAALDPELVSADSMVRVSGALGQWSAVDRLVDITCPTLVLAGRHDLFCSPQQLARIVGRIPHADHVVSEKSGHFMWLEEPDRFFPLVAERQRATEVSRPDDRPSPQAPILGGPRSRGGRGVRGGGLSRVGSGLCHQFSVPPERLPSFVGRVQHR